MAGTNDIDVLEKFTKIIGPSGFENQVQEYFTELMNSLGCRTFSDKVGNCYAEIKGYHKLPKIMMNAHADTVGFMINHIDDKGFIFTKDLVQCSPVDPRALPGTDVVIFGRHSGKKAEGHFDALIPIIEMTDEELQEPIERFELSIDIGARSLTQARSYVDIGDYAAIDTAYKHCQLKDSKFLTATNLDDRLGLFCMYKIAKEIKKSRMQKKATITFVSTVAEETGSGSAGVAARKLEPDFAVTIDATVATDNIRNNSEDYVAKKYGSIGLEKGPALPRGIYVNDEQFRNMERICRGRKKIGAKIPYQVEAGRIGTENEYIQMTGKEGVKTVPILIPVRNLHTRVETASLRDVDAVINLCLEYYKRISRGTIK